MAITSAICSSFKQELLQGKHSFESSGGHTFKIALFTSSASLGAATTDYSTSNEISNTSGSAYTAGGATLTKLLGTSAWYAPGAAVSSIVQSIACNQHKMFPCSALLNDEYGLSDLCIGVPVILGKNGIEKIIELELDDSEYEHLKQSAESVKKTNNLLD